MLTSLEQSRITIETEREEIASYKEEIKALKAQLEEKQDKLEQRKERIIAQANEEAHRVLREAKEYADQTIFSHQTPQWYMPWHLSPPDRGA